MYILSFCCCRAAEWNWQFSEMHTKDEAATGVCFAADGSCYLVGSFNARIAFGPIDLGSSSRFNSFLAHFDRDGTPLWAKRIAGPGNNTINDVCVDGDGDVITIGRFNERAQFGDTTLRSPNEEAAIFVSRYSAEGKLRWARILHDNTQNTGECSIAVDKEGFLYTTSLFFDTCHVGGTTVHGRKESANSLIVKLTADGEDIWTRRIGAELDNLSPDGNASTTKLVVDADGNCTVVGVFGGRILLGDGVVETPGNTPAAFALSYAHSGSLRWYWHLQSKLQSGHVSLNSVDADADGNLFFLGDYRGSVAIEASEIESESPDILLLKADSEGRIQRIFSKSGEGIQRGSEIACSDKGECIISGSYRGATQIAGDTLKEFNKFFAFLAFFDSAGSVQWTGHIDTVESSLAAFRIGALDIDQEGTVLAAGSILGHLSIGGIRYQRDSLSVTEDDMWLGQLSLYRPSATADRPETSPARLTLAPMPAGTLLNLTVEALETGPVAIEVIDIHGRKLLARDYTHYSDAAFACQLDLTTLAEGVYILKVQGVVSCLQQRLIVQR